MLVSHNYFIQMVAVTMVTGQYNSNFCNSKIGNTEGSNIQGPSPFLYDNIYVYMEYSDVQNKSVAHRELYYSQQGGQVYNQLSTQASIAQTWIKTASNELIVAETSGTSTPTCEDLILSQAMNIQVDSQGVPVLSSAEEFLGWNKNQQKRIRDVGTKIVRGMSTKLWYVCSYDEVTQMTSFTHWYFVDPSDYSFFVPNTSNTTKLRLPLITISESTDPQNTAVTKIRTDFTFYDSVQPNGPIFQLPTTLLCQSTPSPQLPTAPPYFKYKGEQITIFGPNMPVSNPVSFLYSNVAYMYDLKLYVEDFMTIPNTEGNDKSYGRTVDDFSVGLSFEMDLITGDCKTKPIFSTTSDSIYVSDGVVQMRTPEQFFDLDSSKYQYKGIHNKRGIDCDVWTAYFTDKQFDHEQNTMYTWYFANPEWMKKFGYINWTHPFPVSLDIEQEGTFMYNNYYEFDTQDTIKIPDLSLCFDPSDTMNIEFFLNATYDKIVAPNYGNFLSAIPIALFSQTSLNSFLRISQLDIQPANRSGTVVRFKLLDIGVLPVSGDVSSVQIMAKNSEIYKDLETVINSGTFAVDVQNSPVTQMGKMTVYAQPHSLGLYSDGKFVSADGSSSTTASTPATRGTGFSSFPSPTSNTATKTSTTATGGTGWTLTTTSFSSSPSPTSNMATKTSTTATSSSQLASSESSISSGAIAGICIGMLILGAAAGVSVFYLIKRFRRVDQNDRGAMDMKPIIKE